MKRVDLILILSVLTIATLMLAVKLDFLKSDNSQEAETDPSVTVPPVTASQVQEATPVVADRPRESSEAEPAHENETDARGQADRQKLLDVQKRLIDEQSKFAQLRRATEAYYLKSFASLQAEVEATIASLETEQRTAWARFSQELRHTMSAFRGYEDGYGYSGGAGETIVAGNPAKEYSEEEKRIAGAKIKTLASYRQEYARLQARRELDLARLDSLERESKGERVKPVFYTKPKVSPGKVTGIVSSEDGFCALVGTELVREGDTVGGVKIVKIYTDKVEFEKNGKRWTQGLNETPSPEWQ